MSYGRLIDQGGSQRRDPVFRCGPNEANDDPMDENVLTDGWDTMESWSEATKRWKVLDHNHEGELDESNPKGHAVDTSDHETRGVTGTPVCDG